MSPLFKWLSFKYTYSTKLQHKRMLHYQHFRPIPSYINMMDRSSNVTFYVQLDRLIIQIVKDLRQFKHISELRSNIEAHRSKMRTKLKIIDEYPSLIPKNVLPTYAEVIKAIHSIPRRAKETWKIARNSIVSEIITVWNRASLPIMDSKTIKDKVFTAHERYLNLISYPQQGNKQEMVNRFKVN